ncbi:SitI6 family double-CXXCG motif immunity protein [Myxococcus qinghaiensis]|uniref:SitI6 family double-CXXCG motif immunity protein n=1 Tax=Myxococcus qinghaiensis TaxID=2906758 RepID=UPI0020A74F5C|nr:double-CXXCG motif protein [Myxococcus qinghaiensis]MCP3163796.1 double-CXXCG motif protein [Myxococcus qinghaiensis]
MPRIFWLTEDRVVAAKYGGEVNGWHKQSLPGARCHVCGFTWTSVGHQYPNVDLSQLPERHEFERARPEPFLEFARLRELVRPLAPPHAELPPGTGFGPLVGQVSGELGPITWVGMLKLLLRRDALERLEAEGVRGLFPCRTELRYRKKDAPEMLELQVAPHGRLHPDCIPQDVPPPCPTCGRYGISRPDEPVLDAASLPAELDLFRVGNFATMMIGTERFMEAVRRLELEGISFQELPMRDS